VGESGPLVVYTVTPLVVHDKHLSLLQRWGQCGVGCGRAQGVGNDPQIHSALTVQGLVTSSLEVTQAPF
jgi:hypothetical protein